MQTQTTQRTIGALLGFIAAFAAVTLLLPERSAEASLTPGAPELSEAPAPSPAELSTPESNEPSSVNEIAEHDVPDPAAREAVVAREEAPSLGVLVWGRVTESDGSVPPDPTVMVLRPSGDWLRTKADDEGKFTLGPLEPGEHHVIAGSMHYFNDERDVVLVAGEELHRQDFSLQPKQRIAVRVVTSNGEPSSRAIRGLSFTYNAVPVATREDPGDTFTGVRGSLNNAFGIGSFWFGGQIDVPMSQDGTMGILNLNEPGPAWVSLVVSHQVLGKERVDEDTEEVTFVLDPEHVEALRGTVSGRLVDAESGTPLSGVVHVSDVGFPNGRDGLEVGADGLFTVHDVLPGKRFLIADSKGRAQIVQPLVFVRGETREVGDIQLHTPVDLAGVVKLESGAGVEGVLTCGRVDPATGEVHFPPNRAFSSNPDGTFVIPGLEPGIYLVGCKGLRATPPRSSDPSVIALPIRVDARDGSVDDLELTVEPTTAITVVAEKVGEPWPIARVATREASS